MSCISISIVIISTWSIHDHQLPQALKSEKLGWQYTGGSSAGFYGMLKFNAFSYPDIARLQEAPNSEYRCATRLYVIYCLLPEMAISYFSTNHVSASVCRRRPSDSSCGLC